MNPANSPKLHGKKSAATTLSTFSSSPLKKHNIWIAVYPKTLNFYFWISSNVQYRVNWIYCLRNLPHCLNRSNRILHHLHRMRQDSIGKHFQANRHWSCRLCIPQAGSAICVYAIQFHHGQRYSRGKLFWFLCPRLWLLMWFFRPQQQHFQVFADFFGIELMYFFLL